MADYIYNGTTSQGHLSKGGCHKKKQQVIKIAPGWLSVNQQQTLPNISHYLYVILEYTVSRTDK